MGARKPVVARRGHGAMATGLPPLVASCAGAIRDVVACAEAPGGRARDPGGRRGPHSPGTWPFAGEDWAMLTHTTLKNPLLMKNANLIAGRWMVGQGDAIPVVDPATGLLLGSVPNCGAAETRHAIAAASEAFPA